MLSAVSVAARAAGLFVRPSMRPAAAVEPVVCAVGASAPSCFSVTPAAARFVSSSVVPYCASEAAIDGGSGAGEGVSPAAAAAAAPAAAAAAAAAAPAAASAAGGRVLYDVDAALAHVRGSARAKFDETVELCVQLGVDPRKPNQSVRGVVQLPHGTGKAVRIAVFARGDKAEEARAAGAAVVGAEDLVESITAGNIDFNKVIATPDVMPLVGRVARILGPKGLMPNPKLGTVTPNVADAVKAASAGQADFRVERKGIIMAGIGKLSFTDEQLKDNIRAFMIALSDAKPDALKGQYFRKASMCSTMGPGFAVDLQYLNPSNLRFMQPAAAFLR